MSVVDIFSLAFTVIAGVWAVGKFIAWQFSAALDQRFKTMEDARREGRKQMEDRFARIEERYERLDGDVRRILQELPREYVRREDYVRGQSVIEAKIDALALRLENIQLRGVKP